MAACMRVLLYARACAIIMTESQFYHLYNIMRGLRKPFHERVSLRRGSLYRPLYLHINELFRGCTARSYACYSAAKF